MVASASSAKDFTNAGVKAGKYFICFSKKERARCHRQHLLYLRINVGFKGVFVMGF
jgi:hypothetical protein